MTTSKSKIILSIFFFSGIAGLAYQVVWVKLFANIFGHTIYAVSTVTAVFMGGLALGSYFFGKMGDKYSNPLKLYAILEFGIAIYALIMFFTFPALNSIYQWVFHLFNLTFSSFSFSRLIFSIIILLFPASLIGGTFPVISKYYINNIENVKNGTGKLYAVNTLGAVIGVLSTGFFLIEWLGLDKVIYCAAGINLILAFSTYTISKNVKTQNKAVDEDSIIKNQNNSFILYIYALTGFAALALEVLWTRELSIVFFSTTYSFSTVLVTFLIGLSAGGYWLSVKKIKPDKSFVYVSNLILLLAVFTLLSIPLLRILPQKLFIETLVEKQMQWDYELFLNFGIAFVIIIIPTFLMGALFPLICAIYSKSGELLSTQIGKVYAYNTFGSVLGSLVAGFILIPVFGILDSINLIVVLYIVIAILIIFKYNVYKNSILVTVISVSVLFIIYYGIVYKKGDLRPLPPDTKVLFAKEDVSAEVKVLQNKYGRRSLYINEKQQGGTNVLQTERWAGEIPLLFHSSPDSVLLIGLGTGVTMNALLEGGAKHITCAEVISSVSDASIFFKNINNNILDNKEQITMIEADGINFLSLSKNKYNIILADIIHPDDVGSSGLYSTEFYENAKNRLETKGFLAQWIVLDQIHLSELKLIFSTFSSVFPNMQIYLGQETNQYQKLLLLGPKNKLEINIDEMKQRLDGCTFSDELKGKNDIYSFISGFVSCGKFIKTEINQVSRNSLMHPRLEYMTPKHRWLFGKGMRGLEYLRTIRKRISDCQEFNSANKKILDKYFDARTNIINGRLADFVKKKEMAEQYYLKAGIEDVDTLLVSDRFSMLAWQDAQNSNMTNAVLNYKRAISINRKNSIASLGLADLLMKMGNTEESLQFYKYTVQIDSNNHQAYRKLGDVFTNKQEFENAFYSYSMSINIYENQPVVYFILGQIYLNHKNDTKQAIKYFQKSLELNSQHRYSKIAFDMLKKLKEN